jgi:hypothetical protein
VINDNENIEFDSTLDVADLDLGTLSIVSMMDSAALPETGASYKSSSCCVIVVA